MPESPATLEYATPGSLPGVSLDLFWATVWCCAIAGGGGLMILGSYSVTRFHWLPFAGMFWLFLGGITNLTAFVCGVAFATRAIRNRCRPPATPLHVALALALPWVVGLIALFCMHFGAQLADLGF